MKALNTASALFDFCAHIHQNLDAWSKCDVILTCPVTHASATSLFPDKKNYIISDFSDLYKFQQEFMLTRFSTIGLISPFFIKKLMENLPWMTKLMQLCTQGFVTVSFNEQPANVHESLLALHQVGFYHVMTLFNVSTCNFLSAGVSPTGEYHVNTQQPGISSDADCWTTYHAFRMKCQDAGKFNWSTPCNKIVLTADKHIQSSPEVLSIAVVKGDTCKKISGVFSWNERSNDHAAFISCYAGPGDNYMYALLVGVDNLNAPLVSLWKNNGAWMRLYSHNIITKGCEIELWLQTTDTSLIAGTGEKVLFSIEDNELHRTPCNGVRIFGDKVMLSSINLQRL